MLERHSEPVETSVKHSGGTVLEVIDDGQTKRFQLRDNLDPATKAQIERLAQRQLEQPNPVLRVLSPQIVQSVDRATRSSEGWVFDGEAPQFIDAINRHTVEYIAEGQSSDVMHRSVLALHPRVADVWRLVTATALEAWKPSESEPPSIWLDVRELLEAMGFEKHHKGGYRQEHVQAAADAIGALCNLWVVVPMGSRIYPEATGTKRRKGRLLTAERRSAVLVKLEVEDVRDLFGGSVAPLRWHVRAGQWIKDYPRQFAPMLKALVELNASGSVNVWCKAIGTELTYLHAEIGETRPMLSVRHLLERSGLLPEVSRWATQRNSARARDYFERALDQLQRLSLFGAWSYETQDFERLEAASRAARFECWLDSRVRFEPTPGSVALPKLHPPTN